MPVASGILAVALIWLLLWALGGRQTSFWGFPGKLVEGADGRASTSKLQFLAWTVVTIFSYVAIWVAIGMHFPPDLWPSVPRNLMIAMGLSIGTATAAKAITASQVDNGQVQKLPPQASAAAGAPSATGPGAVFQDDAGFIDLSKCQMLAWTAIAILAYLVDIVDKLGQPAQLLAASSSLPDIDPTLMVLMGLGQGAYLGKKLVTTATPRLTGIRPAAVKGGDTVTLTGVALGAKDAYSLIMLDRQVVDSSQATVWNDNQVDFKVPAKPLGGGAWSPSGQPVAVSVFVSGAQSNTLPLTVSAGEGERAPVPARG